MDSPKKTNFHVNETTQTDAWVFVPDWVCHTCLYICPVMGICMRNHSPFFRFPIWGSVLVVSLGHRERLFQDLPPFPTALKVRRLAPWTCWEFEAHYVNYTHLEELRASTKCYTAWPIISWISALFLGMLTYINMFLFMGPVPSDQPNCPLIREVGAKTQNQAWKPFWN